MGIGILQLFRGKNAEQQVSDYSIVLTGSKGVVSVSVFRRLPAGG